MLEWLRAQKQTSRAVQHFWSVVLVSALGETLDRISVTAARQVFVEGFMAAKRAYELLIPTVSLGELYGERLLRNLAERGVTVRLNTAVDGVAGDARHVSGLMVSGGTLHTADYVVLAVPWRHLARLMPPPLDHALPGLTHLSRIESSAITGVHLWFDQPLCDLPHAVLMGRTSQWVFQKGRMAVPHGGDAVGNYVHVVISASRTHDNLQRDELIARIVAELRDTWPSARRACLLHGRVVCERHAVFSPLPGVDQYRPRQQTLVANLMLCGDWTDTGWPATMEGAVRSGYLAAEAVLRSLGRRTRVLVPGLPRGVFARLLCGSA
jgi:squalene-associated FAD-dependent desaturase